jgi:hypothetical protein
MQQQTTESWHLRNRAQGYSNRLKRRLESLHTRKSCQDFHFPRWKLAICNFTTQKRTQIPRVRKRNWSIILTSTQSTQECDRLENRQRAYRIEKAARTSNSALKIAPNMRLHYTKEEPQMAFIRKRNLIHRHNSELLTIRANKKVQRILHIITRTPY